MCRSRCQVLELSEWVAERYFENAFELLPVGIKEGLAEMADYRGYFKDEMQCLALQMRTLWSSPDFHHVNVSNLEGAKRLAPNVCPVPSCA